MITSRRALLTGFLVTQIVPLTSVLVHGQQTPLLPLTRACEVDDTPTLSREAGPFFKPNAPLKQDLYLDVAGSEPFTIAGYVVDQHCRAVPRSLIEIWHADENGDYDRQGFRLRGHQFADEQGCWWFNTVMPAHYPGRTRHFHFRVQRPGGVVLTTQLFFPGEPGNVRDWLFDETLLISITDTGDGRFGRFDFVV